VAAPAPTPNPGRNRHTSDIESTAPVIVRAVVVAPARPVAVRLQVASPPVRTRKPVKAKPRPHAHRPASALAANFDLPPILGPAFLDAPDSKRVSAVLAAVALLVAALTAGSGAGLVRSWSRR
jgi:hypothetical protein